MSNLPSITRKDIPRPDMHFKCDDGKIVPFHSARLYDRSDFVYSALKDFPTIVELVVPFPAKLIKKCLDVLYATKQNTEVYRDGETSMDAKLDYDMYGPFSFLGAHESFLTLESYDMRFIEQLEYADEHIRLIAQWESNNDVHIGLRKKIMDDIYRVAFFARGMGRCSPDAFLDILQHTADENKSKLITRRYNDMQVHDSATECAAEEERIRNVYSKLFKFTTLSLCRESYGSLRLFVNLGLVEPIETYVKREALAGNAELRDIGCKVVCSDGYYRLEYYIAQSIYGELELTNEEAQVISNHSLFHAGDAMDFIYNDL